MAIFDLSHLKQTCNSGFSKIQSSSGEKILAEGTYKRDSGEE